MLEYGDPLYALATIAVATGAAARITRLITADTITEAPRQALLIRIAQPRAARERIDRGQEAPPPTPLRATLAELLTCHWCVGFWAAAATTAALLATDHIAVHAPALALAVSYLVGWFGDNERE